MSTKWAERKEVSAKDDLHLHHSRLEQDMLDSHKALRQTSVIPRPESTTSSTGNNSGTESWSMVGAAPPSGERYVPEFHATECRPHFLEPSLRNTNGTPDPRMKCGLFDGLPAVV